MSDTQKTAEIKMPCPNLVIPRDRRRTYEKPSMTLLYRKVLVTVDSISNVDSAGKSGMGMCKHTWCD